MTIIPSPPAEDDEDEDGAEGVGALFFDSAAMLALEEIREDWLAVANLHRS